MRQASPTQWFGGKQNLSQKIADLLPDHLTYVEPFGGAASVLFTKPRSRLEVYNDVDEGLVNFFRVLRDEPAELRRRLELSPYSRAEYALCHGSWREIAEPVEKARRWWIAINQTFGAKPIGESWAAEYLGRAYVSRAQTAMRRVDRLDDFAQRLRGVQIECLDWREILMRYDAPEACFYIDPPYLPETRRGNAYNHELTADDHTDLIEHLATLQASVVLSGYDSDLYRTLEAGGFERIEFETVCYVPANERNGSPRTEVVWRRGEDSQPALFAGAGV